MKDLNKIQNIWFVCPSHLSGPFNCNCYSREQLESGKILPSEWIWMLCWRRRQTPAAKRTETILIAKILITIITKYYTHNNIFRDYMMAMAGWKINNFSIQISSIIKKLIQPAHISFSFFVRRIRNSHMNIHVFLFWIGTSQYSLGALQLTVWCVVPWCHTDMTTLTRLYIAT